MLTTKLKTNRGGRVYCLCFHPVKTWILASLHSGQIQLWDYRVDALIDRFDEHEGPARGVHFQSSQPLFVSGGDDRRIKVWDYETHKCLFTLEHGDRVRTVQFHHEMPWIVSAGDDHTIRIWNSESGTLISELTGHTDQVSCASFHPKEDLVVSASLDQTVRVWDVGSLKKTDFRRFAHKYVLRGHAGGVNWASFHPTLPLIVSGANDCRVKLWSFDAEAEGWEVSTTLEGHTNNVSSVMFHARQNIIVSNSVDKSIRVWDATPNKTEIQTWDATPNNTEIQTFSHEPDRFWMLAVHPKTNLFASGHDNGMIVFKLRKRPAFTVSGDSLLYAKDGFLRYYDYSTRNDSPFIPTLSLNQSPRTLSYSRRKNAVLICSDLDGGSYELYIIPKDSVGRIDVVQDAKRGTGGSAVFIARRQFAVLEKSTNQVLVKNLKNEVVEERPLDIPTDAIFYAGTGHLLCRSEGKMVMFELEHWAVLGELQTPFVKHVVWDNDMERVAFLSKHAIIIASKKLVLHCKIQEKIRVKSGAWGDNGVFVYATLTHIKGCLPNGDIGIIVKVPIHPFYITKVSGNSIFCLDLICKNRAIRFNQDKTNIWWDLENVQVPSDLCGNKVYDLIRKRLTEEGFFGPMTITAVVGYADSKVPEGLDDRILIHRVRDYNKPVDTKGDQTADVGLFDIVVDWLVEEGHERQNVCLFSGDNGFLSLIELVAQRHTTLVVFRKVEGQEDYSTKIRDAAHIYFDDWRLFLYLLDKQMEKERKAATIAKAAKDKKRLKNQKRSQRRKRMKLEKTSAARAGAVDEEDEGGDADWSEEEENDDAAMGGAVDEEDMPVSQIWSQKSSLAAEQAAAGNVANAKRLLQRQLGIKNFEPLESMFLDLSRGSHRYLRGFSQVQEMIKSGYKATTSGKFIEALRLFLSILHTIPLVVDETRKVDEVKELVALVKEYVLGLKMLLKGRENKDDPVRQQELAAYVTHCKLQAPHLRLTLLGAMGVCYRSKNFATAYNFAQRLLKTKPVESQAKMARHVVEAAKRNMTDETKLNYDSRKPFVICGSTYVPIYRGEKDVSCPYCTARFVPSEEGNLCSVCDLAVIGPDASGLLCSPSQAR